MISRIVDSESKRQAEDADPLPGKSRVYISECFAQLRGQIEETIMDNSGLMGLPIISQILVRHYYL